MSFIGGIFGVTIALVMLARKKRFTAKELLLLGDMIFAILPFGIMVGRIGNFLNQELYGIVVSDWLPRL
jgi:phosphatidylglycerol:prolipoprotein diacylglycerol transferase